MDLNFIPIIIILLFSVVFHEVSHGAMANYLGDSTAKNAGRLTLNPIPHLDPIGSIIVPGFLFLLNTGIILGWAKPVPVNPYNFRDQKYGGAKVAAAGPLSNLSLALFFGLLLRFVPAIGNYPALAGLFYYVVFINVVLAIFNLLPIPPLDGSHILFTFLPDSMRELKVILYQYGTFILIFVVIFFLKYIFEFILKIVSLIVGV